MDLKNLQKKYPRFIYESYSCRISGKDLKISFNFRVEPGLSFNPVIIIQDIPKLSLAKFDNLIFNLGLIEMISYWKATCSPTIEIKAGSLNKEQINFWQGLILKGMGQFFFENKIPFQKPKLITGKTRLLKIIFNNLGRGILVPVGGGKDSAVTLELMKKAGKGVQCFSLNPTGAALKTMKVAGCKKPIIVRRKIDKKLLELNRRGFLNGHTPFSAYLAFSSLLAAAIFGQKYVALSNERSSNEGNVKYLGRTINHQWSKSFEFEQKFRNYCKRYLAPVVKEDKSSFPPSSRLQRDSVIEYFSFLRPLYEIQIAKLFGKYPKYFPVFLSCNEAYKTASGTKLPAKKWCGKCSKCLFVFTILYPFLGNELIKIFNKNLFKDKALLPIMQELIGEKGFKPFECVGTEKESLAAFYLSLRSFMRKRIKPPFLLRYFEEKILPKYRNLEKESEILLSSRNSKNNLPEKFKKIFKYSSKKS